jgi:outer membrane lipoprotein-sorting protein
LTADNLYRFARAGLLSLALAWAAAVSPALAEPTPQDQADIKRVEDYLNGIHTMTAKFVQIAPNGRQLTGTFYLSRPGKMRLEYDPPIKDFIVSDGWFLFYWDGEMNQQSSTPVGSSLADVILREDLKLSGDITVTALDRMPGALEVTLRSTDDPGKGEITLAFEDKPLRLSQWRVRDAQGQTTRVGLIDPKFEVPLERGLFYFHPPAK